MGGFEPPTTGAFDGSPLFHLSYTSYHQAILEVQNSNNWLEEMLIMVPGLVPVLVPVLVPGLVLVPVPVPVPVPGESHQLFE